MNGLLHRLADRAAGTAVPVRSDVRAPYGSDMAGWADATEAVVASSSKAMGLAEASQAPEREHGSAEAKPPPMIEPMSNGPERSREPLPASTQFVPRGAQTSERAPVPASAGEERLDLQATAPRLATTATRQVLTATVSPAQRAVADPIPPVEAERSRSDPAPLMPRTAGDPAAMPRVSPASPHRDAWPPTATASTTDDATEVHVHIGRIDVTAVHEAAPPRRKPASMPGPMSLDSYLARRSRS